MSRCYADSEHPDPDNHPQAVYAATVTYTAGLMLLCEQCAARDRETGDVLDIRSLRPEQGDVT